MLVQSFTVYEYYEGTIMGNYREVRSFKTVERAQNFATLWEKRTSFPTFVEWQLHRIDRHGRQCIEACQV